MKKLLVCAALAVLAGCGGGGGGDSAPAATGVTGTYVGLYSVQRGVFIPGQAMTLTLNDNAGVLSGTYATADGGSGVLTGTSTGNTINFYIDQTGPTNCLGHWGGSASVNGNLFANFSGSSCIGRVYSGSGAATLIKQ